METTLDKRIERLEAENRRLKGWGLTAIVLLGALGLNQGTPDVVQARAFEVVDEAGTVRASLALTALPEGPELALYGEGKIRARLSLPGWGPEFILFDALDEPAATLRLGLGGPLLDLKGEGLRGGKSRIRLDLGSNFGPGLVFWGEKGPRMVLAAGMDGPRLELIHDTEERVPFDERVPFWSTEATIQE